MAIDRARTALAQVFFQRCFYLFVAVLALIMAVLLIEPTPRGRVVLNIGNLLVVVAAVAAVGRTQLSFVIALLLAAPALFFQVLAIDGGESRFLCTRGRSAPRCTRRRSPTCCATSSSVTS